MSEALYDIFLVINAGMHFTFSPYKLTVVISNGDMKIVDLGNEQITGEKPCQRYPE